SDACHQQPVRKSEGALRLAHALRIEATTAPQLTERSREEYAESPRRKQQHRVSEHEAKAAARAGAVGKRTSRRKADNERARENRRGACPHPPPGFPHLHKVVG